MTIELFPPLALHEKGRRDGNEDCIYPALLARDQQASTHLFLVCDGVGGMEKGEEASRLACATFAESLSWKNRVGEDDIRRALVETEQAMDRFIENHPEAEGMATTLTLLNFDESGATVAHIGDSRVYHFRNGKVLFRTTDHSMVNDMVAQKILTPDEALTHPKRNIISRAISGGHRPTRADVTTIADIRAGDFFFMCTDGVLESVSDGNLSNIIGHKSLSEGSMLGQIFTLCQENSRDNYSAYLLKVKNVQLHGAASTSSLSRPFDGHEQREKSKTPMYLLLGAGIAAMMILLFLFAGGGPKPNSAENVATDTIGIAYPNLIDTVETDKSEQKEIERARMDSLDRAKIVADSIAKLPKVAVKKPQPPAPSKPEQSTKLPDTNTVIEPKPKNIDPGPDN